MNTSPSTPNANPAAPRPVNLEEESVAGEEDPGAALDLPKEPQAAPEPAPAHQRK